MERKKKIGVINKNNFTAKNDKYVIDDFGAVKVPKGKVLVCFWRSYLVPESVLKKTDGHGLLTEDIFDTETLNDRKAFRLRLITLFNWGTKLSKVAQKRLDAKNKKIDEEIANNYKWFQETNNVFKKSNLKRLDGVGL